MINAKEFHSKLPKDCYEICTSISRQGFCLTLVGGAVRDYLLSGQLSDDFDFEIKHLFSYSEQRWERMLKRLFNSLSQEFNLEFRHKGMNVYSVEIGQTSLEFSSPRVESFETEELGHKNFVPTYTSNLDYKTAFKRRDFSINAIGIFFGVIGSNDEFQIIDPFLGVHDLEEKTLKHLSDDFFLDPVRMLRLIRFKHKLGLRIDDDLLDNLGRFNLSSVTHFYILNEFLKSHSLLYFKDLFDLIELNSIPTSSALKEISFLGELAIKSDCSLRLSSADEFINWCTFHKNLTDEQKSKIVIYFGHSQKKLRRNLKKFHNEMT